jgi:hypothetical protein
LTQTEIKGFAKNELGITPLTLITDCIPAAGKSGTEKLVSFVNVYGTSNEGLKIAEPVMKTLPPLQMVSEVGETAVSSPGRTTTVF